MQAPSTNAWAMCVGAAAALAMIMGILFWQRRQRKARGVRPPNTRNLLRPPGHTLSNQLDDDREKLVSSLIITAGGGAIFAVLFTTLSPLVLNSEVRGWILKNGFKRTLLSSSLLPAITGSSLLLLGCLCGTVWGVLRSLSLINHMRIIQLGLRGEQAVAEALLEVAEQGYRSFHDFPGGKDWNIDHVVVGPGGVFAIETKTRSKHRAPPGLKDHEVRYDGVVLRFPRGTNRDCVDQAKRNAKSLAVFLKQATGLSVWVNPVLVVPGWYVVWTSNPLEHAVRAMPETALADYLRGFPRSLSDQQIQQIAFQVDQKCRDVEF